MRHLLVVPLLSVLVGVSPGRTEESRKWMTLAGETEVTMTFATPESDEVVAVFACDPKTGGIAINVHLETVGIEAGDRARLVLSGPGGRTELAGVGFDDEMNGIVAVRAEARSVGEALKPFAKAGQLVISVPGAEDALPLDASAAATEQFRAGCRVGSRRGD